MQTELTQRQAVWRWLGKPRGTQGSGGLSGPAQRAQVPPAPSPALGLASPGGTRDPAPLEQHPLAGRDLRAPPHARRWWTMRWAPNAAASYVRLCGPSLSSPNGIIFGSSGGLRAFTLTL